MPKDALQTIMQSNDGNGDDVVNGGFTAKNLALTTKGNREILLGVDFTGMLTSDIIGNGGVTLQGTIGEATIENSGNYLLDCGDSLWFDWRGQSYPKQIFAFF